MILQFITFRFLDFVDIFLVALLMYQLYKLIRGTVGMSIFAGIVALYGIWLVVKSTQMELLTTILGQFVGVGVLALIILFQQEIRRFLIIVGTRYFFKKRRFGIEKLFNLNLNPVSKEDIQLLTHAIFTMAEQRTGALLVISPTIEMDAYIHSGEELDAKISSSLLQSIFYKNSPLHDGAVIIIGNKIRAAKCILPTTSKLDLPIEYGMRHRSAIGMSEETNTLVIVVSEQTGNVSYCLSGRIRRIDDPQVLSSIIRRKMRGDK
ncbi:MAG TPA: diadenylate cyclase CdaA [Bacteroidales bacterium]|nr:MAG: DNA integrity scanning protein DisA [Bacteroidetes bacterium ADurb.Bin217]HOS84903.1 diadenylate cyclase CdaA [Bacteroidales bacterium]HPM13027.1 diadenylate cyclase CdaA [Bacteroidales bacterium]